MGNTRSCAALETVAGRIWRGLWWPSATRRRALIFTCLNMLETPRLCPRPAAIIGFAPWGLSVRLSKDALIGRIFLPVPSMIVAGASWGGFYAIYSGGGVNALATWKEINDGKRHLHIGLRPGDPIDELSKRNPSLLTGCAITFAFFPAKTRRPPAGSPHHFVDGIMARTAAEHREWEIYPVSHGKSIFRDPNTTVCLSSFYDDWAERLTDLAQTEDCDRAWRRIRFLRVVMHLHSRLQGPSRGRNRLLVSPCTVGLLDGHGASDHCGGD